MPVTAKEIIDDAFDDLEIKTAEVDLTDGEYKVAIRRLNRLGTAFSAEGLFFGYTTINDKSDTVTVAEWAEDLFVSYLAIRIAPSFGVSASQELIAAATTAMEIALLQLVRLPKPKFPNTLPIGAGNIEYDGTRFFTDTAIDDLETSIDILTDGEGNPLEI